MYFQKNAILLNLEKDFCKNFLNKGDGYYWNI